MDLGFYNRLINTNPTPIIPVTIYCFLLSISSDTDLDQDKGTDKANSVDDAEENSD